MTTTNISSSANTASTQDNLAPRKSRAGLVVFVLLSGVAAGALTYPQWKDWAQHTWQQVHGRTSDQTLENTAEQELTAAADANVENEDNAPAEEIDADNIAQLVQSQQEEIAQLKEQLSNLNNALSIPDEYAQQAEKITALEHTITTLKAQIADVLLREQQYAQPLKDMKAWWLVQQMQSKFKQDDNWHTLILQFMGNFTATTPSEQEALSHMQQWSLQPPLNLSGLEQALRLVQASISPNNTPQNSVWEAFKHALSQLIVIRRVEEGTTTDISTMSDEEILSLALDHLHDRRVAPALEYLQPLAKQHASVKDWMVRAQEYLDAEKDLIFLNNVLIGRQIGDMNSAPHATMGVPAAALPNHEDDHNLAQDALPEASADADNVGNSAIPESSQ